MIKHWEVVRHFNSWEFDDPNYPGSGINIDGRVLFILDNLREEAGVKILTHYSVGGCVDMEGEHGHSENSYHLYENNCKAVDWHFEPEPSFETMVNLLEERFNGLGFYPSKAPGVKMWFHTDTRSLEKKVCWLWTEDKGYIYYPISQYRRMAEQFRKIYGVK